ncbi:hypothetical protein MKX33_00525 [Paenibacillus sp. FSL R5-0490]|uniref:hypothetical protein n=1 Tax=Paenibacillus sp. FSL R5-0490 TaxID=1920424 RepID=UPI0030D09855
MKKVVKNISLVLGGVVLGVAISFSGEISAATSKLLGGKVGKVMTVTLDNKSIGEAPVIGGTSYVPVRTAANELGLEVKVSGNEIKLTTPEEVNEPVVTTPTEQPVVEVDSDKKQAVSQEIETAKRSLQSAEKSLELNRKQLTDFKTAAEADPSGKTPLWTMVTEMQKDVDAGQKSVDTLKAELASLEAQLAALK